ncbi:hypothetical protein ACH35V_19855 [Actinomadura sp. 1N219]|uniref:hypothetical protein n=1 Tax=Actinomadura sp. 1N219 TaxID=3375152 RepID=UPI003796F7BC
MDDDGDRVSLGAFREAVESADRHTGAGAKVEHALCTSGGRLNDAWCRFLAERDVLVGLSVDGGMATRTSAGGGAVAHQQTFEAAQLLRRHGVDCNVVCLVHAGNADHPYELYRCFRDEIGVRHVQFLPFVERTDPVPRGGRLRARPATVSERTIAPEQWGAFLVAVFDEWVRRDVGRQFVKIFEDTLAAWSAATQRPRAARAGWERLPLDCRCCPVLFACEGGRPVDRFAESPHGEPGLNYLCAGYREFFDHVDQPMRVMAALLRGGRDADAIMKVMARYERERPAV